jgi:hypothetical protein
VAREQRRLTALADGRIRLLARMIPDPQHDVMVYQVVMVDALSGVSLGERWTVWIGTESEGSYDSEGEAIESAIALAADHGRPAWLTREGRPPILL